jgi:DNA-binding response OmpR family regulator
MACSILIAEDDPGIARILQHHFARESWTCRVAEDGEEALRALEEETPDLVLLDVMLPLLSGLDVCQAIRRKPGAQPAVLMVSARTDEMDAVLGLAAGADDYVRKPFGVKELIARCRTLLVNRASPAPPKPKLEPELTGPIEPMALRRGPLFIDTLGRRVHLRGERLDLTPTEFGLLHMLARKPGQVVTRASLLERVGGYTGDAYARTIDSHVARLRRKLEEAGGERDLIQTVFGVGYRLVLQAA